ncbi:MAG TPA: hypothetical protein VME66_16695, partial [Candidatus Acidoferrales bacterium]|nr:hypothetical protein [Candidatus Acidoferrales bacterium]
MARRLGSLAVLVFIAALGTSGIARADTEVGFTGALFFGRHVEEATSTPINGLPAPLLFLRERVGRVELYAEGLASLGQINYNYLVPSAPAWTTLNYLRGSLRYYTANKRYYVGLGAVEIYQKTG